jgi:predicted fused transcriptional regulator/phosphomethylpyrimidine kinase/predicted transcriptional regulator
LLPYELVSKYVAPRLRALVAARLVRDYGVSQVRVSRLLGVTQPMVSKYLAEDTGRVMEELRSMGLDVGEVENVVSILSEVASRGSTEDYARIFTAYLNSLLSRGALCGFHRSVYPGLSPGCSVCRTLLRAYPDTYVEEVSEAFKVLSGDPLAYRLIPEVGSNVVSCRPGARSTLEVVGFSGRVIRVGERVVAVGEPTYGGSRHLASVLLVVRRFRGDLRGAVAIRYSRECVEVLRGAGLRVVVTGPHGSRDEVVEGIARQLEASPESRVVDAVADVGGSGIEPVIYVFGSTALEAVRRALLCARVT